MRLLPALAELAEGWLHCCSNLIERTHHSRTQYLLLGTDHVISLGGLLGPLGCLALIPPLIAARLVKHATGLAQNRQEEPGRHKRATLELHGADKLKKAESRNTSRPAGTGVAGQGRPAGSPSMEAETSRGDGHAGLEPGQRLARDQGSLCSPAMLSSSQCSSMGRAPGPGSEGSATDMATEADGAAVKGAADSCPCSLGLALQRPVGVAAVAHLVCALGLCSVELTGPQTQGLPASSLSVQSTQMQVAPGMIQMPSHALQAAGLACVAVSCCMGCWRACRAKRPGHHTQQTAVDVCARTAVALGLLTMHCAWLAMYNWALAYALLWLGCPVLIAWMHSLLRPAAAAEGDQGDHHHTIGIRPGNALSPSSAWQVCAVALVALCASWCGFGASPTAFSCNSWSAGTTLSKVWIWLVASWAPVFVA